LIQDISFVHCPGYLDYPFQKMRLKDEVELR
jgi:hypothetical protein